MKYNDLQEKSLMHDFRRFRFTNEESKAEFREPCFQEIISTDAFRRLLTIHFLGSIDLLLSGARHGVERRHTRYDHSLSVAALAKRFLEIKEISGREYRTVIVAALLHDIGHAPLSHSLEPSFRSIFDLNHHKVGERIIRGDVKIGVKLSKALERCELNNFEILATISGHGQGSGKDLFSRAINVDTVEGILRSASYMYRKGIGQDPLEVIFALAELGPSSHDVLDQFWMMKDRVYSELIQGAKGLMADFICNRYMLRNAERFQGSYYYGTESELRRDHQDLFDALEAFGKHNQMPPMIRDGEELVFSKREFYIDKSVVLNDYSDIDRRYLQRNRKVVMEIKKTGGDDAHSVRKHTRSEGLF